jgi:pimeloyl-ACP methyl ester carboxylesterase
MIGFIVLISDIAFSVPYPVVFVHGTGDSSVAWKNSGPAVSRYLEKYYKTSKHQIFSSGSGIGKDRFDKEFSDNARDSCIYVTFSDHFAGPDKLSGELKKTIDDTVEETWANFKDHFRSKEDIKVNLVCHSLGGLAARKYLVDNYKDHHVSKLVLIGVPNKGISVLTLNWLPAGLVVGGAAGFLLSGNPLFLSASVVGAVSDALSYARGVKLISEATGAMKPDSMFLSDLNGSEMPSDVEYVVILCRAEDFLHASSNRILGYEKGDGAISFDSQSLKHAGIPNFKELNYRELEAVSSHFEEPSGSERAIIEALNVSVLN